MKIFVIVFFVVFALLLTSCSEDKIDLEPIVEQEKEEEEVSVEEYKAPTYADHYLDVASWADRADWNLANVHDPSVVFDGEYYYMYGTDASYGGAHLGRGHFLFRRSRDLVNWEFRGLAMAKTPGWVKDTLNSIRSGYGLEPIENPRFGHWAPVVRKVGDVYRLYYSIIIDNYIATGLPNTAENFDGSWTEHAFIGLMETKNLELNIWTDRGMVIRSVSDRGSNWSRSSPHDWSAYFKFNAIDPSFVETPEGEQWLIYGSWHSGIAAVEVDPATGKPYKLDAIDDFGVRIARRENNNANRWQALEGPEIIYNEETGYYYLFLAYDELSKAYNTRVARSQNITGPYYGINGANISNGADCWPMLTHPYQFKNHSGWVGFAHCGVFKNEETGDWFYTSQARLPDNTDGNPYSNAIMMGHVNKIRWTEDGWPVVLPQRYAAVPQDEITEEDLVGAWENITMEYRYQAMQKAADMSLASNKTASGAFSGSWSYDEEKKILTIGSTKLYVDRELDWEADPRVPTIVYSGLTATGRPIWGKKVD